MLPKPAILKCASRLALPPARRLIRPPRLVLPGTAGVRPSKNVVAQTLSFGPGTYTFTWPEFNQIVFDLYAPGGGGGGAYTMDYQGHVFSAGDGSVGGWTYIDLNGFGIYAYGGQGAPANNGGGATQGAAGGADNGDSNITGGGAAGGVGGAPQYVQAGNGGAGGRVVRTVLDGNVGAKLVGQTSTLVVGFGGAGGPNGAYWIMGYAGNGANGFAYIYIS